MLKFVVLLTVALTAIPNAFGEIELPPLLSECLEDFKILLPKGVKAESECRERNSVGHERFTEGYYACKEEWENGSDNTNFMAKCESALSIDLTEPQKEELNNRIREMTSKKIQANA